ncbi:MAG: co-chaperone GroES [Actinomycetota bacterium]
MGLRPLGDRVLVRPEEGEETLPSGLVLPDTAKEKSQEGTVVAVGPGQYWEGKRIPLDLQAGDRVIFSKFGGQEVKVDGEDLLIMQERDVLGVVTK